VLFCVTDSDEDLATLATTEYKFEVPAQCLGAVLDRYHLFTGKAKALISKF
jgi:hypothetical protein